jgi:hypothetical protein
MRYTTRVLLVLLLAACCCPAATAAEQSGLRLWPFRGDRTDDSPLTGNSLAATPPANTTLGLSAATPSQPPTTSYTADSLPEQRWMVKSPFARVSWPRIHMPEFPLPRPKLPRPPWWSEKPPVDDGRNTWVQKSSEPTRTTPLVAMQQGAQRVGQSTRTAWRKTVDVLTPGEDPSTTDPRVAARDQRTFWQRLNGTEQTQKPGSQTVTEMLSQERIGL